MKFKPSKVRGKKRDLIILYRQPIQKELDDLRSKKLQSKFMEEIHSIELKIILSVKEFFKQGFLEEDEEDHYYSY